MKNKTDMATGIITMLLAGIGTWSVVNIPLGEEVSLWTAASFPKFIVGALFLCGLGLFIQGLRSRIPQEYWPDSMTMKKMFIFMAWFGFYSVMIIFLGDWFAVMPYIWLQSNAAFGVSSAIFLCGAMLLLGRRHPLELLAVSIGVPIGVIVVFGKMFQIFLP